MRYITCIAEQIHKYIPSFFLLSFFLYSFAFSASPTFADEIWSKKVEIHGNHAEIQEKDFDFFALHIPYGTRAEALINGKWEVLERETERDPDSILSKLISWNRGEPLHLRFNGVPVQAPTIDFMRIDASEKFALAGATAANGSIGSLPIISRKNWGADEKLRYSNKKNTGDVEKKDSGSNLGTREKACINAQKSYPDEFEINYVQNYENGKELIWSYQYSKRIRKVVIHHTAESGARGKNAEEMIRGIYYYHTVSRGWGDIGYHYIISPDGKIFEGRAGGKYIVGGHAYCHNIGTIGIALMGNFEVENPTTLQIDALQKLLPQLAEVYELDLTDTSWYHGEKTPNLLGHRDLTATACPGKNMYSKIPALRRNISHSSGIKKARSLSVNGEIAEKIKVIKMKPGETKDVYFSFKNTGEADWLNSTWLFAQAGKGIEVRSVSSKKRYVAAKQQQKRVKKGEIANFKATIIAGYRGGVHTISFVPVVRDQRINNAEILQVVEVESPNWDGRLENIKTQPPIFTVGESNAISVDVRNTGKTIWHAQQAALELTIPSTKIRTYLSLRANTPAGKVGRFSGRIPAFSSDKTDFLLRMRLQIAESPTAVVFIKNISSKTSSDRAVLAKKIPRLVFAEKGKNFSYTFLFTNEGNTEWTKENLKLQLVLRRKSITLSPQERRIPPGQTATFRVIFPAGERIEPYIYFLKNGYKKLTSKLFLLYWKKESEIQNTTQKKTKNFQNREAEQAGEKNIRVKLSFPENLTKVEVTADQNFSIFNNTGKKLFSLKKGEKISIYQKNNLLSLNGKMSSLFRIIPEKNGTVEIQNWKRYPAWDTHKKWNDNRFYGTIEVQIFDGKILIINDLPMTKYILGIGETIESDHPEKKKALAVVARSYATFYQKTQNRKFPGKPYDASDNPAEFQKYLGVSLTDRSPGWKKAVEETKEKKLYYAGKIIKPPYHTSSGGKTISAKEKWGWTNTPYLQSLNDPGCQGKAIAGHRVGMSGCGAQYFAKKGWDYINILKYYYPGAEVK